MSIQASSDHALVLFSGGQDSTTCLAWALARYPHVETVGFAYGQRHAVELDCRAPIRAALTAFWPGRLGPDHIDRPCGDALLFGQHSADQRGRDLHDR